MKRICFICNRVRAGTEHDPDESASHGLCARCILGYEKATGVPLSLLVDKANREDPKVKEALEYVKSEILDEVKNKTRWIGEGIKYSEDAERVYKELLAEAESEINTEAGNEIKMR